MPGSGNLTQVFGWRIALHGWGAALQVAFANDYLILSSSPMPATGEKKVRRPDVHVHED